MNRWCLRWILLLLFAFVVGPASQAGDAGQYVRMSDYRLPLITIPMVSEAPQIDGRLAPGEWDVSAGTGAFIDINSGYLVTKDVQVRVAHDENRLYICFRSPLEQVPAARGKDDVNVWKDEPLELFISKDRKNFIQFIGTAAGSFYDARNDDGNWNAAWQFANSVEDGIWTAEIAVGFRDLGHAPPIDGEEWAINFCRSFTKDKVNSAWSDTVWGGRYANLKYFGRGVFGKGNTGFEMIPDLSRLHSREISWSWSVINRSDAAVAWRVDVRNQIQPADINESRLIEAGTDEIVTGPEAFQKWQGRFYSLTAWDAAGSRPFYQQLVPISPATGELLVVLPEVHYNSQKVRTRVDARSLMHVLGHSAPDDWEIVFWVYCPGLRGYRLKHAYIVLHSGPTAVRENLSGMMDTEPADNVHIDDWIRCEATPRQFNELKGRKSEMIWNAISRIEFAFIADPKDNTWPAVEFYIDSLQIAGVSEDDAPLALWQGQQNCSVSTSTTVFRTGTSSIRVTKPAGAESAVAQLNLPRRVDGLRIHARLSRDEQVIATAERALTRISEAEYFDLMPDTWQPGEYSVAISAFYGDELVARKEERFNIAEYPEWWGNELGMRDTVQPPYTPIERDGRTVSMWGKQFHLDDNGFPGRILSQGEELLAGPASLTLDGTTGLTNTTLTLEQEKPTELQYDVKGTLGPFAVSGSVEALYDGFLIYDLSFTPTRTDAVDGLTLDLPFAEDTARYTCLYPPRRMDETEYMFKVTEDFKFDFTHHAWFGNLDRGLSWYTESREGWTAAEKESIEVIRNDGRTLLRIHILASGPAAPFRLQFGLVPTPVQPLPKDWRALRHDVNDDEDGYPNLRWWGQGAWSQYPTGYFYVGDNAHKRQFVADFVQEMRVANGRALFYNPEGLTQFCPEYRTFHYEWDRHPRAVLVEGGGKHGFVHLCPRSNYQDFFVHLLDKMIKEFDIDGVYQDGTPIICSNAGHGCGYEQTGVRQQTFAYRAWRDFVRRMRQVFLDNGKEPFFVVHLSGQIIPPLLTNYQGIWNGEQYSGKITDNDYTKFMDLTTMRIQWTPKLTGTVPFFMSEIYRHKAYRPPGESEVYMLEAEAEKHTRTLMAFLLPNDIVFGRYRIHWKFGNRIWKIWEGLVDAKFVSHLDGGLASRPVAPMIQTGLYIKPEGDAVLVVGNITAHDARVTVTIDPAVFSLADRRVTDILDGKTVTVSGREIRLDVGAKDFRLVAID